MADTDSGGARKWFVAGGAMLPLSLVLLVCGLTLDAKPLVVAATLCNVVLLPLLLVGMLKHLGAAEH